MTPIHNSPGARPRDDSHGNSRSPRSPNRYRPTRVCKVAANSVPLGELLSANGEWIWAAYSGDELVAVGPTAPEVRDKVSCGDACAASTGIQRTEGEAKN